MWNGLELWISRPFIQKVGFIFFGLSGFSLGESSSVGSIMLSPVEIEALGLQNTSRKEPEEKKEVKYRLDGIYFISSKDWVVWINGQRITPDVPVVEYTLSNVSHSHVDLKDPLSSSGDIRLYLN